MDVYIGKTTLGLPVADLAKGHANFKMNRVIDQHLAGDEIAGLWNIPSSANGDAVTTSPDENSFIGMMLNAMDETNRAQNNVDILTQQAIVDPASVDVHDVTIAMAKANMTLSISKAIIERSISGFKDILNQR
ncbi:flagellar hook-basal body complex protein FliE [Entomospira entomophila]|uniref:Flagellar hook-basal body complex protein FliE n=1 Tax=Entomospira entomophila TaxID=2719988 RepID=A0A968GBT1_9SPIO|nr:flagellar hook-basal body complex protein FliE [Entomospira entomophilus]NIZ40044.1 flagellar hook-basal body complex protein FliE [Entomospira entomophilus]WDI35605.1 flagellar hook-basal body complex protein FliE [Entomospira entomophilus]